MTASHQELHRLVSTRARNQRAQVSEFTRIEHSIRLHVQLESFNLQRAREQDLRDRTRAVDIAILEESVYPCQQRAHCPRSTRLGVAFDCGRAVSAIACRRRR